MKRLEDKYLLECYTQAVQMGLETEFIELLLEEINKRKLPVPDCAASAQTNNPEDEPTLHPATR